MGAIGRAWPSFTMGRIVAARFSFLFFFFSSPSYTPRDVVTWANIITILRDILRALAFKSPPSFLSLPVSLFPSFN